MNLRDHRLAKWCLAFLCWTMLGLIFSSQSYVFYAVRGGDVRWVPTLAWVFAEWYTWALLSPLIFWLAKKLRIERRNWSRSVAIHLAASVVFCIAHAALQAAVNQLPIGFGHAPRPFTELFKYLLLENYSIGFLTYWVLVGISHFVEYYHRYRDREALLIQAQLQALKMQLQPHFLFNSLNSIASLIDEDRAAAIKMIARLGDFLRMTLHNSGENEITLEQEIEFLRRYLEIEMIRFENRLTVKIEVDPEVSCAKVPNLILQPIVENAIRHGVSKIQGPGHIEIRAKRLNGTLYLQVEDNGKGLGGLERMNRKPNQGLGLANTRARLMNLYGSAQSLEISNMPSHGLRVAMEIPLRIVSDKSVPPNFRK